MTTTSPQELRSVLVPPSEGSPSPVGPTVWGYFAACSLNKTLSSPDRTHVWPLNQRDYCDAPPERAFLGSCKDNLGLMVAELTAFIAALPEAPPRFLTRF